jgi:hypothetical protein
MDIHTLDISSLTPEMLQALAYMPGRAPPQGVVSNFENPPSRAALQIWSTSVCMALALLFFFNRLYIKARLMKKWSWDDCMLTLPLPCPIGVRSNIASSDFVVINGMLRTCPFLLRVDTDDAKALGCGQYATLVVGTKARHLLLVLS